MSEPSRVELPVPGEAINLINANYWLGGREGGPSYHADNAIRGAKMVAPFIDRAARIDELRRMANSFDAVVKDATYSLDGREDRMVVPTEMLGYVSAKRDLLRRIIELGGTV